MVRFESTTQRCLRYSLAQFIFFSNFPGSFDSLRLRAAAAVARYREFLDSFREAVPMLLEMRWLQGEVRAQATELWWVWCVYHGADVFVRSHDSEKTLWIALVMLRIYWAIRNY